MTPLSLSRISRLALLACSTWLLLGLSHASAQNSYSSLSSSVGGKGQFSNVAVFTLNANAGDSDLLSGNARIVGDVGVAGTGKIGLSGNSSINGDLSYFSFGSVKKTGNATINGRLYNNFLTDIELGAGSLFFNLASSLGTLLPTSNGYPTTIDSNRSLSLKSSGLAVLKLSDFELSGNATLTLQGTAASYFVFNVSQDFSLSSNANIKLSGGLSWDHVIFNVKGKGLVTLTDNSELDGILLATKRNVVLSDNSRVVGTVIANTVSLSGNSSVQVPVVSP